MKELVIEIVCLVDGKEHRHPCPEGDDTFRLLAVKTLLGLGLEINHPMHIFIRTRPGNYDVGPLQATVDQQKELQTFIKEQSLPWKLDLLMARSA